MSLASMVHQWADATGRHRLFVPLPTDAYEVCSWASWLMNRHGPRAARLLLGSYCARQVCADPSRRFPLPQRPVGYRQALAHLEG